MIRRKTPFGFRVCQQCNNRMIRGAEMACSWCLRGMSEIERAEHQARFWSHHWLVPTVPSINATTRNQAGREFISHIRYSMPVVILTNAPVEVQVKVVTRRKIDLMTVGMLVVDALKQGEMIMYHDQARIIGLAQEEAGNPRTEITVRRLHEDEVT